MKGIFVNSKEYPYAERIVSGFKTIETRSRNMLAPLVGERVAIVRTGKGKPQVIGYVTIKSARHFDHVTAADCSRRTYVFPDSKFSGNRWFYYLDCAEMLPRSYLLPSSAIRHGRSWCEF